MSCAAVPAPACRNLDLTAIIINNQTYGMTGGQSSPTAPYGAAATTVPYGHIEHAFSIAELAVTDGASFVARGTVFHASQLAQLIEEMNLQAFRAGIAAAKSIDLLLLPRAISAG